jgi:xanthine dehydrogenase YagS FAD-binding subunit
LNGRKGERTVGVENFHVPPSEDLTRETVLEPGEILTDILLPPPPEGLRSSYRKVRGRRSWDFALAGVALAVRFRGDQVTDSRVVLSGAAPIPWRSLAVEEVIKERRLDSDTISNAVDAVVKHAEPLEQNGYKIPLFRGIIEEQLLAIA